MYSSSQISFADGQMTLVVGFIHGAKDLSMLALFLQRMHPEMEVKRSEHRRPMFRMSEAQPWLPLEHTSWPIISGAKDASDIEKAWTLIKELSDKPA